MLLINPQTPSFIENKEYYVPSSLLYLAAVIKRMGSEAHILDLNIFKPWKYDNPIEFCKKKIIDEISCLQPDIIGLGCLFSGQFPSVADYSETIKQHFNIRIVIGGIHPTLYAKDILTNCPFIDWVVLSEGEETITSLIKTLEGNFSLDRIEGFAYRNNGNVIINNKRNFIKDLDSLPFPAYELINVEDYYHDTSNWHNPRNLPIKASLPLISSRSCPMRCSFCSMFMVMGQQWRVRSETNFLDEVEFLYHKYDHHHFSIFDDNFTLNRNRTLGICRGIVKRGIKAQFETPNGISVANLDEEVIEAMVAAGFIRITLAIESGSDYIRNQIMGKRLSREKIVEIIRITKKYPQLYVRAFFIMGMPEDTLETLQETYNMIKEIDIDKPIVSNLLPFPGTKLFEQVYRDKLFTEAINQNDQWKNELFYFTNNKKFFVKPYNLTLTQLCDYRLRFDVLLNEIITRKSKEKRISSYAANQFS